jgi:hypothetical protein
MFVFPLIEGVTSAKLEFELLILHLWFGNILPLKSYYLLNDVDLDNPLVPRLDRLYLSRPHWFASRRSHQ